MDSFTLTPSLEDFFRLQLDPMSQAGILRLEKGKASSERQQVDPEYAHSLLLIEGEMVVEVDGMTGEIMHSGCRLTVPKGVKHRFINRGNRPAVAFTVAA